MKRLLALGISIGVLAGLFTWFAGTVTSFGSWETPMVVWVGFAAWAVFYAAGAGRSGLVKAGGSTLSGLVWGWAIVWVAGHLGGSAAVLGLAVAVAAFAMCVQAAWAPLAFIPGAFIGAASYFGNGTVFWATAFSLVLGVVLAYVSERGADVVERLLAGRTSATEAPAATA